MTAALGTLIVIAKEPVPGRVKTRLCPPLTYEQAAEVAAAAIADTLHAMSDVPAGRHLLALEGTPDGWVPAGWEVVAQPDGPLDVRLVDAFAHADPDRPAVLVGMDTPQVRPHDLAGFDPTAHDACLGPAEDGGYWAIGLRTPNRARDVISDVPMSTTTTGAEQLRRLRDARLRTHVLGTLADVDTYPVARRVAALAPGGAFAAALANFSGTFSGA